MNCLVVDTVSARLEILLRTDDACYWRGRASGLTHNGTLAPAIAEVLTEAGIQAADLDLLVVPRGPGSFTGLRIGFSVLKGIQAAVGCELTSVSSLEAIAEPYRPLGLPVLAAIDARKKRFYAALFSAGDTLEGPADIAESGIIDWCDGLSHVLVAGPDAPDLVRRMTALKQWNDEPAEDRAREEYAGRNAPPQKKHAPTDQRTPPRLTVIPSDGGLTGPLLRLGMKAFERGERESETAGPDYVRSHQGNE